MTDINKEALDEKVAEINALGKGKAIGVQVDVRDYAQVCKARDAAIENFGSIDIMINMAGGAELRMLKSPVSDFKDVPIEVYDWSIDVNLKGTLYFNHAVMPQMVKQKSGVIINTGSITGEEGSAGNICYFQVRYYERHDKISCTVRCKSRHQMLLRCSGTCSYESCHGKHENNDRQGCTAYGNC